jgi:hypothetical protein
LPSIEAQDGCNSGGQAFQNVTIAFAPGALASISTDGGTYSFNFADLPCPPPEVEWDPASGPYAPAIAPIPFLSGLDPKYSKCITRSPQDYDSLLPITPGHLDVMELTTAASGSGDPGCGIHCGRQRRAAKAAHPVPRLELEVVQTPTPAGVVGHG